MNYRIAFTILVSVCLVLAMVLGLAITSVMQDDLPPVILTYNAELNSGNTGYEIDWNPGLIMTPTLQATSDLPPAVATYNASLQQTNTESVEDFPPVQTIDETSDESLNNFMALVRATFKSLSYGYEGAE